MKPSPFRRSILPAIVSVIFCAVFSAPIFAATLPAVSDLPPEPTPHFPNRLCAFVFRNWNAVEIEKMAEVLGTEPENIAATAKRLGLPDYKKPTWNSGQLYITLVRRNWHLLPFEQICSLTGLSEERLAFSLLEDDFLWVKLGCLKPRVEPLRWSDPTEDQWRRIDAIGALLAKETPAFEGVPAERFGFIAELKTTRPANPSAKNTPEKNAVERFPLRYVYSYFAIFGDPLSDDQAELYPDGLLEKLHDAGVNGVWLHIVLRDMAPGNADFPEFGQGYEKRQANLKKLVDRAKKYGIDVYLYINEPRAMQPEFFENRPEMAGVRGGQGGALQAICTSTEPIKKWIGDALCDLFTNVPGLGGVFTITASENLTTCASHGRQKECPRCSKRTDAEIIAEINAVIAEGVHRASPEAKVIAWDWGWKGHSLSPDIIEKLPRDVWFMSVSEWATPIDRGGIKTAIGEYSISAVGPGPRAVKQWATAREGGRKTVAKVQFNTTWECGSVPFIPAMDLVARHCRNLAECGVDGLMMSWSLGGHPSPNLDIPPLFNAEPLPTVEEALDRLALLRYGPDGRQKARLGWSTISRAFEEFPYSGSTVYDSTVHIGPANLLRPVPTGFRATMVGIPYDDLNAWRGPYPPEIFASQMEKTASGFAEGIALLREAKAAAPSENQAAVAAEIRYADAVSINYQSTANQTRFILARDERLRPESSPERKAALRETMLTLAEEEIALAKRLYILTQEDSRVGFESTNQYFYLPNDLLEKIVAARALQAALKEE